MSSNRWVICSNCQQRASKDVEVAAENVKKLKNLENLCAKQEAEIERLNDFILQYKQKRACEETLPLDLLRNGHISHNSKTKVIRDHKSNTSHMRSNQNELERWTETEAEWIRLTDELRVDLEAHRHHSETIETELLLEKKRTKELDDALMRSVNGHGKLVEHYADLLEKYDELVEKHHLILEGITEVKRAAAKAGGKGNGKRFYKSLAMELS